MTRAICALLIASTVLVYAPVRRHEFVAFDDPVYVVDNPAVRAGLSGPGVVWAFTQSHGANWHPLTWLSHMADVQLFGLDAGAHLLVNVALHAASSVLLFLFFWRTTHARWPSAFVAAAFALHPLRVESVAWASERKDVLAALFWMLTLHAWVSYARAPGAWRYLTVAVVFVLGLMAKPMLVTLPFVLLLLDLWPLGRLGTRGARSAAATLRMRVVEKLPLLALSAVVSAVTFVVQRDAGAMFPIDELGFDFRIPNALVSYATYIADTAWPSRLAVFYPFQYPVPALRVAAAAIVLVSISAVVAWTGRRRPYLLVGWLWYLGVLVPVIGLVWVGEQARADRFTYLPQIGLLVMLAWGIPDLLAGWAHRRAALGLAAALVLAGWSAVTARQVGVWRDTLTLYRHAIAVTDGNYLMHANLAAELAKRHAVDAALAHYREAIAIEPRFPRAHLSLATLLMDLGRTEEALPHYAFAAAARPDSASARFNYGLALAAAGRVDEALRQYDDVLRLDPGHAKAQVAAAGLLAHQGRLADAVARLRAALHADPALVAAHGNLAIALERLGHTEEALVHYRETVRLAPGDPRAHQNLAAALEAMGAREEALQHYRAALGAAPESPELRAAVARLSGEAGGTAR